MNLLRNATLILAMTWLVPGVDGQELEGPRVLKVVVIDGDSIPCVDLREAVVEARWVPKTEREAARYDRLTRQVVKVYPYARITGELLREYENDLAAIRTHGGQELYIKLAEAELRAEFEAEVKDLTAGQGRALVKLIDRETGQTSYELVKELRGDFTAFVWQGFARLFGQDLRSTYDAEGNDRMMELIVQRIESGELPVAERSARTAKAQARLQKRKARLYKRYGIAPPEAYKDR